MILWLLTNIRHANAQTLASTHDRHSNLNAKGGGHLDAQSTIGDILLHPAFEGFSRLILPWDDRVYAGSTAAAGGAGHRRPLRS
jgi:hypothetical protein